MPGKTPLFLLLDQGGHASRATVIDANGRQQASAEAHIATRHPAPDRVEHDPEALLNSIRRTCKAVARQLGKRCMHIQCAGLATQRSTIVCWDRQTGKPLSPVISWQDRRAAQQLARLSSRQKRVHTLSGLVLSPHYGASKIAWCLEHLKPVQRALARGRLATGPLASYLLGNLLAEKPFLADPVNASRTLLWDYRQREWSPELLALFQVPASILPRCVPNRFAYGHIILGKYLIPMKVVTGDQPAALFAAGKPDPASIYINLGTGAFLQRPWGNTPPRVAGLLSSVLWQTRKDTAYVLEGTVNGAGSALEWLRESAGISQKNFLAQIPGWLGKNGQAPLFLNGVSGLGSPFWISDFSSRFIGEGDIRQKAAAVAESMVFLCCLNLERMRSSKIEPHRMLVSGGIARWNVICQWLADLSGLPVYRPHKHEATTLGLGWLLGVRTCKPVRYRLFRPNKNQVIRQRYAAWSFEMLNAVKKMSGY
ncbi:MAG: hypothetical protein KGL13_09825 [Gammaproteobacteria bacterium]|nr:hypothetical protein [Gammaproteobacteria bacterium]